MCKSRVMFVTLTNSNLSVAITYAYQDNFLPLLCTEMLRVGAVVDVRPIYPALRANYLQRPYMPNLQTIAQRRIATREKGRQKKKRGDAEDDSCQC